MAVAVTGAGVVGTAVSLPSLVAVTDRDAILRVTQPVPRTLVGTHTHHAHLPAPQLVTHTNTVHAFAMVAAMVGTGVLGARRTGPAHVTHAFPLLTTAAASAMVGTRVSAAVLPSPPFGA